MDAAGIERQHFLERPHAMQDQYDTAFLTLGQVAVLLGVSVWTVRRLVRSGQLVPVRFGDHGQGHFRFPLEDVDRLIDESRKRPSVRIG